MSRTPRLELSATLIETTRKIIAGKGLSGFNARDLAKEVGCAVGTIYNLFDSLEALILQVNGQTLDQILKAVQKADQGSTPQERLFNQASAYLKTAKASPHLFRAVFERPNPGGDDLSPDWLMGKINLLRKIAEGPLEVLFPKASPKDIEMITVLLWTSVNGLCLAATSGKLSLVSKLSAEFLLKNLIQVLILGFKTLLD